jgi:hypothetical protein
MCSMEGSIPADHPEVPEHLLREAKQNKRRFVISRNLQGWALALASIMYLVALPTVWSCSMSGSLPDGHPPVPPHLVGEFSANKMSGDGRSVDVLTDARQDTSILWALTEYLILPTLTSFAVLVFLDRSTRQKYREQEETLKKLASSDFDKPQTVAAVTKPHTD